MKYRQCQLVKENITTVSWIPEKYAKLNKVLKLKNNDVWTDGWIVTTVSEDSIDESNLPDYRKDIRNHRKATGDSLGSNRR